MADGPDLYAPLSPEACAHRLQDAIDPPLNLFGEKAVIGLATSRSASLRRRLAYRNSALPRLEVTLSPEGEGARLACSTEVPPFPFALMLIAFMVLVLFAITGAWPALLAGVILMGSSGVMVLVGRSLAQEEEKFLVEFLRRTLDAHDIPPRRLSRPAPPA